MSQKSKPWWTVPVGRRTVLKGIGATALLGGLRPVLANAPHGLTTDRAVRLSASHWGAFHAHVESGRVTYVVPFEGDPFPSPLIQALTDRLYADSRVKYPMVRAGFLKDGKASDTTMRGRDSWVRVPWDEALDLVASELKRVKDDYGNPAIYGGSYGWYSNGKLHAAPTLLRRLLTMHGGFVDRIGDYSTAASQVIMPHVVGTLEVYEQQTAWPVVIDNTELVVLWGADPLVTDQIGWVIPDHYAYEGFQQLKAKGTEVVSINPFVTDTAQYAGAETIQIRPNTDVAMMLGVAHTLYSEKLHNTDFLAKYTVGFDQFTDYLTGKSDRQEKSAEWAAGITGVSADAMKTLARKLAAKRTMLMSGWGIQRQQHGEQRHWMLVTLACMLGQIGLPGGGFGLSYHYSNGGSPAADAPGLSGISSGVGTGGGAEWLQTASKAVPVARISDLLLNPGQVIDFNGQKITYPDTKLVYWAGGNPFHHQQDRNKLIRAWQKPETIIVNEPWWTATAKFADIVLPANSSLERNDIDVLGDYSNQYIIAMQKAVDPIFESRSDYDIFSDIAKRLGFGDKFTEGKGEMDWLRQFYDGAVKVSAGNGVTLPDFDTFWEKGSFQLPITDAGKTFVRYADFRENPALNPLGTPSGKIEIYSKTIEGFGYDDCPPHPTWMEPVEWAGSAKAATYPLQLVSPHPKDRLHSQLDNTWVRRWLNIQEREPVWINPADAEARGLVQGDVARVFSERGQLLAGVFVTDRVMKGVVVVHEGAWYDPAEPGVEGTLDKHGDANVLTIDLPTSKLAQGNIAHTALVQVEKYDKPLPAVTAFDPPQGG